jgi:Tfp pilus assembly protein PilF
MADDETAAADLARQLFHRAYLSQQRGALVEAIQLYKESIAHYPTAEAHTFLGWVYAMLHRCQEAIEECHRAIALDPTFGNPYNDIGAYLIELGRPQEAIAWLKKALAAPRYENREFAHMNLGRVYEHLGQWEQAAQCYRSALALNPDYQPARQAYRLIVGKLN